MKKASARMIKKITQRARQSYKAYVQKEKTAKAKWEEINDLFNNALNEFNEKPLYRQKINIVKEEFLSNNSFKGIFNHQETIEIARMVYQAYPENPEDSFDKEVEGILQIIERKTNGK